MRTLKKSLCFVLALVMVIGLFTVGANAALYTDDAAINYDDAVTVLTGLGVIEGYPDSSFKPTANVTRAEAAAMIARMMLGREDADKLPVGDVTFTDVKGTWAEAYIAFCANKGIIVGMGDGTFHPSDNVTGAQMATMLLRALGYGVCGEYEGTGWDINAVSDALLYKIFKDSNVTDFAAPATREETALYIFNTLFVQLVGYDVDRNYYDGLYRLADGKYVQVYFANSVFDLEKLEYVQVIENKYTGSKYTVVRDDDGYTYNLAYETPLDLVAHEVTAYVKASSVEDKKNHVDYYETYLVKDESFVMASGGSWSHTYDDFYRELVAYNKDNRYGNFGEFVMWDNYVEQWTTYEYEISEDDAKGLIIANGKVQGTITIDGKEVEIDLSLSDATITTAKESSVKKLKAPVQVGHSAVLDWDFFSKMDTMEQITYYWSGAYKDYQYYDFADLKGQTSSGDAGGMMDFPYTASYLLDHNGKPLACLRNWYYVGIAKTIDTAHDEVEVKVWNRSEFEEEIFDVEFEGIKLVYDGIAKGDYVVVQPQGELTLIKPTTTAEIEVTRIASTTLNNMYYQDDNYTIDDVVTDGDDVAEVNAGDKVLLYLAQDWGAYGGYYFALQILEKAGLDGIVYLNYADVVYEHTDWGLAPVYKVQAINEDGEEVVYKCKKAAFLEIADISTYTDTDGTVKEQCDGYDTGVYKVYVRSGRATFVPVEDAEFKKTEGKNSFLKRDGNIYYITSDTNVIYFKGVAEKLSITVSSKLKNFGVEDYPVYATFTKSGGGYKLRAVWVPGQTAPDDYGDESFMFITSSNGVTRTPAAYIWTGKTEVPVYSVYIDGQKTEVQLTGDSSYFTQDDVFCGFYQYKVDDNGIYHIKAVTKVQTDVLEKGSVRYSGGEYKLYTDFADGLEIKNTILDVSDDTTIDTKKSTKIITLERLNDLVTDGYTVTLTYVYAESEGQRIPVGVMYVTNVIDHPLAD